MTGLQLAVRCQITNLIKAMACVLSSCKGTEHHLGFLGIKGCPRVKDLSYISLKRWLKVMLNLINLALCLEGL